MIPRLSLAALLIVILSILGALADASPPDPGWIAGFYDAADGDEVVLAVTGLDQAPPRAPRLTVEPPTIHLGVVAQAPRRADRPFALDAPAVRAPPHV